MRPVYWPAMAEYVCWATWMLEKMANKTLFPIDSGVALRQPKTDRLILARFLKDAAEDKQGGRDER